MSERDEDGRRVCQTPWLCHGCERGFPKWSDRDPDPDRDPLREDALTYRFLSARHA